MDGEGDRGTPSTSSDDLMVVATSSTGLLGEFLNQIRAEIELHSQDLSPSDSSSDSEEIEYWYLPRFDAASELRVVSTRYFGQESESDLVTVVMIYEPMESLDEQPPTTSYRAEHLTAEPLTSDEEEETLVVSTAMDEAAGSDSVVDPVPEPPEPLSKKRRSWLSALGRAVVSFGRKLCCRGRRRRLATDASSE